MSLRKIKAREMVSDIRSGLTTSQLMAKYHMSEKGISNAIEQILGERANIARMMVADIRSGMNETDLMAKYQLTSNGLAIAMRVLTDEGFMNSEDTERLEQRIFSVDYSERREAPRRNVPLTVPVLDTLNVGNKGRVKDVTEKGFSVIGVEATVGQVKRLAVMGDDLGALDPFEVKAECRWVKTGPGSEPPVAGFQITQISARDLECLKDFVRSVELET
jgi:hypothetical protein